MAYTGAFTGFTGFTNSVFNTPYISGLQQPNFLPSQIGLNNTLFNDAVNTATTAGDQKWKKILDTVLEYGGKALTLLVQSGVIRSKNDLYQGTYSQQGFNDFYGGSGYTGLGSDNSNNGGFIQQNQTLIFGIVVITALLFIGQKKGKGK